MATKQPKRRVRQNQWGNWKGYLGTKRAEDFGTDEVAAGHWLLTGNSEFNAGYASQETITAARNAAQGIKP